MVVVQGGQALCAECVTAVDEYARYFFSDIETISAVIAIIEATSLVIALNNPLVFFISLLILYFVSFFLVCFSSFAQI